MRNKLFDIAVERFVVTFKEGGSFESTWEAVAEMTGLNAADIQRAVDRARDLTADEWDD
jgi:hypothetical protein